MKFFKLINMSIVLLAFQSCRAVGFRRSRLSGSPLHDAISARDAKMCETLLELGADVNETMDGFTPLMQSISLSFNECSNFILERINVDVNAVTRHDQTALHFAAVNGNEDMCEALLENGANVNAQTKYGETPLMAAVEKGRTKCAKIFLKRTDVDVNLVGWHDHTALHFAAANGNEDMCGALLEKGADVNAQTKYGEQDGRDGRTPLMAAIEEGRTKCAKIILKTKDINVNLLDHFSRNALHFAAENENIDMCEALLEKGADVNAQNYDKETPLMNAIRFGGAKCAKIILERTYVDVNVAAWHDNTALHFAAAIGDEQMCGALLEKGADVNAQANDGSTPLMNAIRYNSTKCVKIILKRTDVDVNLLDRLSRHALHFAAENRNEDACEALLENGANVNAQTKYGGTPLMAAVGKGRTKCAKIILKRTDVDVNVVDWQDISALHYAAANGNEDMCGALLEKDADVNAQTKYGETPLMYAIRYGPSYGHTKCAKMILRKFPNLDVVGETALQMAIDKKNAELIKILQISNEKGIAKAVRILAWKEQKKFAFVSSYFKGKGERKAFKPKLCESIKM